MVKLPARLAVPVTYEPDRLKFKQPEAIRTYIPDWKVKDKVYIETKGKLTVEDRKKMIWVKEQYPDHTFYIFFQNARVKLRKRSWLFDTVNLRCRKRLK